MADNNHICVGVISGVHGINGHVKLKSFTSNPKDIAAYGILDNEFGTKNFDVQIVGKGKDFFRAKIKGISNRNEAEALKGTKLFISREKLPQVNENEYYHTDLIGLKVFCEDGAVIGEVSAVYDFGAGDVLEIITAEAEQIMVPFNKKHVPLVDVNGKKIVINKIIETEAKNEVE